MKNHNVLTPPLFVLVVFLATDSGASEEGNPDFENLKSRLTGSWSVVEENRAYDATFEEVSHGRALPERNSGFIAVYHPDGGSLLMTLYSEMATSQDFARGDLKRITGRSGSFFKTLRTGKAARNISMGFRSCLRTRTTWQRNWETRRPGWRESRV